MRKKIFGQYAGGGVFWPFLFDTNLQKNVTGEGGVKKWKK
jgi:hypothetical protein